MSLNDSGITVVRYGETPPSDGRPILYLAGPTTLPKDEPMWHFVAALFFMGREVPVILCCPTPANGEYRESEAAAQRAWQFHWLENATVRVFWFPWPSYMAYTEFGYWASRGPSVAGLDPATNDRPDPPRDYAALAGITLHKSLPDTLADAAALIHQLSARPPC